MNKDLFRKAHDHLLNEMLVKAYDGDTLKEVYVPFEILGAEMISKLPSVDGSILVISDAGLLVAILRRLKAEGRSFDRVTFLCHTQALQKLGQDLRVKTILIEYNALSEWLKGEDMGMKFDIVVGNPPYSEKAKASDKLWAKFTLKALELMTPSGQLGFITPSGWASSTNMVYKALKGRVIFSSFASKVSEAFQGVGGTQRFTYFIVGDGDKQGCEFDEGVFDIDPTETPFAPQKSSSHFDFTIASKMFNSRLPKHAWVRIDLADNAEGVVVPMAKSSAYEISYGGDVLESSRYKLKCCPIIGEAVASNLNKKLYRHFRWVLRSGPALAGNFKQLPIPTTPMDDISIYMAFGLSKDEIDYLASRKI